MSRMIKHDGYNSIVCEHNRDIMVCSACDVLSQAKVVNPPLKDILKDPIGYYKVRKSIKAFKKSLIEDKE